MHGGPLFLSALTTLILSHLLTREGGRGKGAERGGGGGWRTNARLLLLGFALPGCAPPSVRPSPLWASIYHARLERDLLTTRCPEGMLSRHNASLVLSNYNA